VLIKILLKEEQKEGGGEGENKKGRRRKSIELFPEYVQDEQNDKREKKEAPEKMC
jgi:hypothetical protein